MPATDIINHALTLLGASAVKLLQSSRGRKLPQSFDLMRDSGNADFGDNGPLSATEPMAARLILGNIRMGPAPVSLDLKEFVAPLTVAVEVGSLVDIAGPGTQSVSFAGSTGTLKIERSAAFEADIAGLSGTDTLDLADLKFTSTTQATFLGDANGGTLAVTNGDQTVNLSLIGNYLSSEWTVSDDGAGGVAVVDPIVSSNWQTLKVGGGGFVDGLDVDSDGTMVVRTDTNGAYIWNGSSWQQLVTASSMPASFVAANPVSSGAGVYEIQMAPSNSSVMYMLFDGFVFKSSDKGASWTQTSFNQVTENPNDAYRGIGQKMAVDPNNPNIVYVGTPQNGLFVTRDGGTTWSSVAAVPVSNTDNGQYPGDSGIVFDPKIGGVVNGVTQTVFASSYGNGVYESTNGGSTWTSLRGGPSDVEYAVVSSNGGYYAIGNDNTALWVYANGIWADLLTASDVRINAVAINPNNPNEIVAVSPADSLNVSYDGGKTWSGWNQGNTLVSSDIPWLTGANKGGQYAFLSIGGVAFSTTSPNELIATGGTGVWQVNIPSSGLTTTTSLTWNDMSAGIENLVAVEALAPPGGALVLASWDRPFFYISDLNAYPSTYGPVESSAIVVGWSLDYASSQPSFVVGIADFWGVEESGYSTDGGKTFTNFATELPGADTSFIGGSIAASTTKNFIWAPSGGVDPYYTLDGGKTWGQVKLPGVTDWSGFDWAYYLNTRTVTADRVLANTFYLYYNGVYETTNGGASWTQVYANQIGAYGYNSEIVTAPGEAGTLFYTAGLQGDGSNPTSDYGFYMSTDQGHSWKAIANVLEVTTFGFGAAAAGTTNPSLYVVGYVNKVFGVWASTNMGQSWVQVGTQPTGELDQITTIAGDGNVYGRVYVGFSGGGYAYLSVGGPSVTNVTASPNSLLGIPGEKITFTVTMSEAVTISGGTPTLSLNDGGVATYISGSGSSSLIYSYTIAPTDLDVAALSITAANLNGAKVADTSGAQADFSGVATTFANISIDPPQIVGLTETPANGVLGVGGKVVLDLSFSDQMTVSGGVPTLTLNDGGTATYVSGSGTNDLKFSYTVNASDSFVSSLQTSSVNLNGSTIENSAGASANTQLSGITQAGPEIDPTNPKVTAILGSAAAATVGVGATVTITLTFNEAVTVAKGAPTLTLNDGGSATYVSGSGTNVLSFAYTVGANDASVSALLVSTVKLNGATISSAVGTSANLTLANATQSGPTVDTLTPTVAAITDSQVSGALSVGQSVTLTLTFNEAVNVGGDSPTLLMNDGGVATYKGGSGTNLLTFTYTVSASDAAVSSVAVSSVNLNGSTIQNAAGANAVTSVSGLAQSGPSVSPTLPLSGRIYNASNAIINIAANVNATITGSGDVINATAKTDTISIGGNGVSGVQNSVYASSDEIAVQAASNVALYGASNTVTMGSMSSLTVTGSGNKLSGASDIVTIDGGTSVSFSGSNSYINMNGVGTRTTVTGSYDLVDMNATGETLKIGGNGATGPDNWVVAKGDTIIVEANSRLIAYGANDTIVAGANSNIFVNGTNQTIAPSADNNLWLGGASSSTVVLGSRSVTIDSYNSGNNDVFDLLAGAGGYNTTADIMNALHSDGQGGAVLSLGSATALHILNVAPAQLTAANFRIG